jgi:hypothetical protein
MLQPQPMGTTARRVTQQPIELLLLLLLRRQSAARQQLHCRLSAAGTPSSGTLNQRFCGAPRCYCWHCSRCCSIGSSIECRSPARFFLLLLARPAVASPVVPPAAQISMSASSPHLLSKYSVAHYSQYVITQMAPARWAHCSPAAAVALQACSCLPRRCILYAAAAVVAVLLLAGLSSLLHRARHSEGST